MRNKSIYIVIRYTYTGIYMYTRALFCCLPSKNIKMENLIIFATSNISNGEKYACQKLSGHFLCLHVAICSATPVWSVNAPTTAIGVLDNRSVALFFFAAIQTIYSEVSNAEKICLKGKNSTRQTTSNSTKTVPFQLEVSNNHGIPVFEDFLNELQKRFNIEKDAKNEAYAFILARGLLSDFSDFSKRCRGIDPHKICVTILNEKV